MSYYSIMQIWHLALNEHEQITITVSIPDFNGPIREVNIQTVQYISILLCSIEQRYKKSCLSPHMCCCEGVQMVSHSLREESQQQQSLWYRFTGGSRVNRLQAGCCPKNLSC